MKTLYKTLLAIFLTFSALFLGFLGYFFAVTSSVHLSHEKLLLPHQNVIIYDENGEAIESVTTTQTAVDIENVPPQTRWAFIDTEDKRVYTHDGFDFRRIVKAAIGNLKSRSFKEGASTISQQLIKNTHLSHEKTIQRKLQEWKLTRQLEREYEKDEILEKYLNVIYFGHNCFGIQSAARFYFDKAPSELTLADSAILAGLVKAPNHYSPFKNAEKCEKRKSSVLHLMQKNGHISEEALRQAMREPLPSTPNAQEKDLGYAHFVFDELSSIAEEYAFTIGGKMRLYTYLSPAAQSALQTVAKTHSESDYSMMILDTQTRGFKGCVSSVGAIERLPGSLLKPLLVYAPAMEEGVLCPATPILDEKTNFNGYAPNNFDGKFRGYVSAREALAKSLNVPAVKVLESVGVKKAISYLQRCDLSVHADDATLALALGGMKNGYTLSQLLSAYSLFPNGGIYARGAFIRKIEIDGMTVYERKVREEQVFSKETAYLTSDILKTATQTGTAKKLRSLPVEIAAKTGTAGDKNGNSDAYALSFTTRDCVGVWLGNRSGADVEYTGGGLPCNYLLQINQTLLNAYNGKHERILPFAKPHTIERVKLDKISYYDTHRLLIADEQAPSEYVFEELFSIPSKPQEKSCFFSVPRISTPTVSYVDGKARITFAEDYSKLYQYKIERSDYATHTTLYFGEYLPFFVDDGLQPNNRYVYTITPYFGSNKGESITLPQIYTGKNENHTPPPILDTDWWTE